METPITKKMRAGVDYKFKITCRDQEFNVRPLTNLEQMNATDDANFAFSKLEPHRKSDTRFAQLLAVQMLERASSPDPDKLAPTITGQELSKMTPDEMQYLMRQYTEGVDQVNPQLEKMTDVEINDLVYRLSEEVKKNPTDAFIALSGLSFKQRTGILFHFLARTE